jgi:hypothetical protein
MYLRQGNYALGIKANLSGKNVKIFEHGLVIVSPSKCEIE